MKFTRTVKTTLLLLFSAASYQLAQGQIVNPTGDVEQLSADDLWAQTLDGRYFNEFWTYQIYLNDGLKLHIVFQAANFGRMKSPVSGVRVTVNNLEGQLYQVQREYPIERLVQDRETWTFQLHPEREVWFKGKLPDEHQVRIYTSKDGNTYDIDLKFEQIQPGVRWGDGIYRIGSEEIGILTHIPYAKVSGTVAVNEKRMEVRGTGYMDHTYQDQMTSRMMSGGYRFIHHQDTDTWDLYFLLYPDESRDGEVIGHHLSRNSRSISINGIERISESDRRSLFGESVPSTVRLHMENGEQQRFERVEDEEKFSLLRELGSFSRRIARSFLGGEVIDFRGEGTIYKQNENSLPVEYNLFKVK